MLLTGWVVIYWATLKIMAMLWEIPSLWYSINSKNSASYTNTWTSIKYTNYEPWKIRRKYQNKVVEKHWFCFYINTMFDYRQIETDNTVVVVEMWGTRTNFAGFRILVENDSNERHFIWRRQMLVRGDQRGGLHVILWTWIKITKNTKMRTSLTVLSQLFLKYAYVLDVMIHQFVHMEFFDGTLPILLHEKRFSFLCFVSLHVICHADPPC